MRDKLHQVNTGGAGMKTLAIGKSNDALMYNACSIQGVIRRVMQSADADVLFIEPSWHLKMDTDRLERGGDGQCLLIRGQPNTVKGHFTTGLTTLIGQRVVITVRPFGWSHVTLTDYPKMTISYVEPGVSK